MLVFCFRLVVLSMASVSFISSTFAEESVPYSTPFQEPEFRTTQSDFGGVGLMQMPTGRMAKEGDFSFSLNQNQEYQFYSVSLQLMPWLESTIRYTQVEDVLYSSSESFSGDTKYTDKGIDLKIRLLEEDLWLPEVSMGLRDIGGTGLFDGEFIAATKRFGNFDFTLGLGWGYLGTQDNISSPFCSFSTSYCNRVTGYSDNGGSIDYSRWFTGTASVFGGVEYQTPYQPLRLKLEYDANDYSDDFPVTKSGIDMTQENPWNVGAVYALGKSADIRLSYERGTTLTFGFSLSTNFNTMQSPIFDDPIPPLGNQQATTLDKVDWTELDNELRKIAGYKAEKVYAEENNSVSIIASQSKYRDREVAAERAAAVLSNHLPTDISAYKITETKKNIPVKSTLISSSDYRKIATADYFNPTIKDALLELPPEYQNQNDPIYDTFDPLNIGFSPNFTQSIGSPESFYIYTFKVIGGASYWLNNNLEVSSSVALNLIDNLDELNFSIPSDGTDNYRVRSLVRAYVRDNDLSLNNLQLTWFQKYGQNWYQQVYGGYLETMFAGVGSEVLYRQQGSSWAIGADFNFISQRDPDSFFDVFTDEYGYSNNARVLVEGTTGHLSLYYQPDFELFHNTRLQLDFGRFLAADEGVKIDFSKQFNSGMVIGAYASLTDMSAEDFGEGSFTKGFYFSIPFDTVSLKPTNSRGGLNWQPLTRDGGQTLNKRNKLFSITDMVSPWYQRPRQD